METWNSQCQLVLLYKINVCIDDLLLLLKALLEDLHLEVDVLLVVREFSCQRLVDLNEVSDQLVDSLLEGDLVGLPVFNAHVVLDLYLLDLLERLLFCLLECLRKSSL